MVEIARKPITDPDLGRAETPVLRPTVAADTVVADGELADAIDAGGTRSGENDAPLISQPLELPSFGAALAHDISRYGTEGSIRAALSQIENYHAEGTSPRDAAIAGIRAVASDLGVDVATTDDSLTLSAPMGEPVTFPLTGDVGQLARVTERALMTLARASTEDETFDDMRQRFLAGTSQTLGQYAAYNTGADPLLDASRDNIFGVGYRTIGDRHFFIAPNASSTAAAAGIVHGSEFISINGTSVQGLSTAEVSALFDGHDEVEVEFRIGTETHAATIERSNHEANAVGLVSVSDGIAHVGIGGFQGGTDEELRRILENVEGLRGVVLDLRNNGGGRVDSAEKIIELFRPNHLIGTKHFGPNESASNMRTGSDSPFAHLPVTILVDERSASASEILLSGMQGRAVTIGAPTYGKGIGQGLFELPEGDSIRFTTTEYRGPLGAYHRHGYTPAVCGATAALALNSGASLRAAVTGGEVACERSSRLDDEDDVALALRIMADPELHAELVARGHSVATFNEVWAKH
jgi:carboxyl-terminal processing protease